jgi:hypothetical protein
MKTPTRSDPVRIKPLKWESLGGSFSGCLARTIFGCVEVVIRVPYYKDEGSWYLGIANEDGEWDYTPVESKEEGMKQAGEWYLKQFGEAVEFLP